MTQIDPYNPLDLEALGDSLLRHLERQTAYGFDDLPKFVGSGIYALYYCGAADPYQSLGSYNVAQACSLPIYVGRARGPGARRGLSPLDPVRDPLLWSRIHEHKRSISHVANLNAADFRVRALVVMPIWVPLAEAMAIRRYRPLWNVSISGFGIHDPGSGRQLQKRSEWDDLHPGRSFARTLRQKQPSVPESRLAELRARIEADLAEARQRHDQGMLRQMQQRPAQAEQAPRSRSAASPRPKRR